MGRLIPYYYPGNQDPHKSLQPIRSSNSRLRLPRDQRSTTESTEIHGKENPNQLSLSASFPGATPARRVGSFRGYPFVMIFLAVVISRQHQEARRERSRPGGPAILRRGLRPLWPARDRRDLPGDRDRQAGRPARACQGDRPLEASQGDPGHRQARPACQERPLSERPHGITGGLCVL